MILYIYIFILKAIKNVLWKHGNNDCFKNSLLFFWMKENKKVNLAITKPNVYLEYSL